MFYSSYKEYQVRKKVYKYKRITKERNGKHKKKRITIDGEDYYINLLFYHRKMKRLVVIELKLDKFRPEYKGQVELYLKWLDKYEKAKIQLEQRKNIEEDSD